MARTKIIIPETVIEIGYKAFESSQITEIIIPSKCVILNEYAFRYCQDLTTIYIYSPLTKAKDQCFSYLNQLKTVYYLRNNYIGNEQLFYSCSSFSVIVCDTYHFSSFASHEIETRGYCPNLLHPTFQCGLRLHLSFSILSFQFLSLL